MNIIIKYLVTGRLFWNLGQIKLYLYIIFMHFEVKNLARHPFNQLKLPVHLLARYYMCIYCGCTNIVLLFYIRFRLMR